MVRRAPGGRRRRPHLDPAAATSPRLIARRQLLLPAAVEGLEPQARFAAALDAQASALAGPHTIEVADEVDGEPAAEAADKEDHGEDGGVDLAIARDLATADVVGMGRVAYASNAVFILELGARDPRTQGPLRAIYKPARGERPLWDFPHRTLHLREVATWRLDLALGLGLVPPTVLRDGPHGPGSVQLFVEIAGRTLGAAEEAALRPRLLAMAVLDVLANNADRKSAHLLVDTRGQLCGIDHGLTFLTHPRQRTVLLELGGAALPDDLAATVRRLDADPARRTALLQELGRLLAPVEVEAFADRLAELAADPVYPELDQWDGRPFEWW